MTWNSVEKLLTDAITALRRVGLLKPDVRIVIVVRNETTGDQAVAAEMLRDGSDGVPAFLRAAADKMERERAAHAALVVFDPTTGERIEKGDA